MAERDKPFVLLGVLWSGTTRRGDASLTGRIGNNPVFVLPNRNKIHGDRKPDYLIYITSPNPGARYNTGNQAEPEQEEQEVGETW